MEYNFREIEQRWQQFWKENDTYKVENQSEKPKFYVLDMFPYPSGAGLHVGHPLGYIASDIYSRYKRHNGFNVLHPMGYDAFGLPAEQYAIEHGLHPAATTDQNIKRYREQLDKIGFSYDWNREFRTSDPSYYKWTQWVFLKLYGHWYNNKTQKAEPIEDLIKEFERNGNAEVDAASGNVPKFYAEVWKGMEESEKQDVLMNYRLAYLAETMVNWCPKLGTVLANDEVKDGRSERGGHPVIQKKMKQWSLRVTAYAQRMLDGLETLEWSDSLKEMQRNWIGRSEGAQMFFPVAGKEQQIEVFTTRPDTIYGATFMVLAPEHKLVSKLTTEEHREAVEKYVEQSSLRSERDRMVDTKTVSGVFTGAFATNPFTGNIIPIWISDYVLAGYGTGAIMAVPSGDSRDYAFAKHFGLPVVPVIEGQNVENESHDLKEGKMVNSGFLNGLEVKDAIKTINQEIEARGLGKIKINYRLRDAIFSRQRYWGEPFPVYYKDGIVTPVPEQELPLLLPEIDQYKPTEDGRPPLGRAEEWKAEGQYEYELSTMPGFAGSSAYYLRYMDPTNDNEMVSKEANEYWQDVDLYIGGTEHAVGHLMYSRFWNKFLFDIGMVCKDEPFRKLVNQGMIQGRSNFVYRIQDTNKYVSYNLRKDYKTSRMNVDVNFVKNDVLDTEAFKNWKEEFADAEFILEDGQYICGWEVEKMSKSKYNVVNPDEIVENYGADTLRMYEMFLGPIEQSKPWDTNGIEGVNKFLRRFWRLFVNADGQFFVSDEAMNEDEAKVLHKTIKKVSEDIEKFSYNTSVSAFMIALNELNDLKCNKREVLEPLVILLQPFAPHITEELWELLGNAQGSLSNAQWPTYEDRYLVEDSVVYPVSFNGKRRFEIKVSADAKKDEVEKLALEHESSQKWLDGKTPKKVIVVPGKIINIVV